MTQDEIIRMAREAGLLEVIDDAYQERNDWQPFVERFASLVAAHEREKLIPKVAPDGRVSKTLFTIDDISKASEQGYQAALVELHAAVLAEREACAKVCAGLMTPWDENTSNGELIALRNDGMRQCATAIRARGNHG